tara:strand:- start:177 stop:338 length:162 start_codon:yes stop_codon:yes gene_type:complete
MNVDYSLRLTLRRAPVNSDPLEKTAVQTSPASHLKYPCRRSEKTENRQENVVE